MGIPIGETEKKRIIPALIAAGAALVGTAVAANTSSKNRQSQEDANQLNLQIARETNQANRDLYREQFDDQVRLFNLSNQYNSASQQVQRLSDAGLNPALNMGNGSAGSATMPSVPSASPMQGVSLDAPKYTDVSQTFGGIVGNIADAFKSIQEGETSRLGNQYIEAEKEKELQLKTVQITDLLEHAHLTRQQRSNLEETLRGLKIQNSLSERTLEDMAQRPALENQILRSQRLVLDQQEANLRQDTFLKKAQESFEIDENSRKWTELAKMIQKMDAEISLMASQSKLNINQAANVFESTVGKVLDNKQSAMLMPFVLDRYKVEIMSAGNRNIRLGMFTLPIGQLRPEYYGTNRLGTP